MAGSRGHRWEAGARPRQGGSAGPAADGQHERTDPRGPRLRRRVWTAWGQPWAAGLPWVRSRGHAEAAASWILALDGAEA